MENRIIGLVGFIGSGKGTVGEYLSTKHGFVTESFAKSLKDAISVIFGWERPMLEGDTDESRKWREELDDYWSSRLNRPVSPRSILQQVGTDVLRNHFHKEIWVASLEYRLNLTKQNTVITDVRFPNEIDMIQRLGGQIWWIRRDPEPSWLYTALTDKKLMPVVYPQVHSSEYEWIGNGVSRTISNNSTLESLHAEVDECLALQ